MRKIFQICLVLVLAFGMATAAMAASNARMPAIKAGAAHLIGQQRTDAGWEGTWYWYVGSDYDATNLTGVTALGLLEAFKDVKDPAYLDAVKSAASFAMTHLGSGATGAKYSLRWTAPDIILVQYLGKVTGDATYNQHATAEWTNIKSFYPNASAMDTLFRNIGRPSTWDLAAYMEAAYLSGDTTWANQAAAIISDIDDAFYYNPNSGWYALNLAGSIRALINCGYAIEYQAEIIQMLNDLVALCDGDNGIGGMAFNSVGGAARSVANELGRWLATQITTDGGWIEAGYEYPEINGEAIRALSSTVGTNFTLDGFEPGLKPVSSWRRPASSQKTEPFED